MSVFSENLKKLRKQNNLTQKDIADRLGISIASYSYYESGKNEPNIKAIKMLAAILGTTGDELLGTALSDKVIYVDDFTDEEFDELKMYIEFIRGKRK